MRCVSCSERTLSSETPAAAEARLFSSVLALGALFGLMASPCARGPFVGAFVIFGVPLLTFCVAAPGRLSAWTELRLLVRDVQAGLLSTLLAVTGRRRDAATVVDAHRADVERTYGASERVQPLIDHDPLRLHHARRLGMLGGALAVGAAVLLPVLEPAAYTWGDGAEAVVVFLFDLLVIGAVGRVVAERIAIRLFEASAALSGGGVWSSRFRSVPLVALLGGTLGAIGSLVVLFAAAAASGVETLVLFGSDFTSSALWFLRATAPMALPLGVAIGAIMGLGSAAAQTDRDVSPSAAR
jgi:hypothetical protein